MRTYKLAAAAAALALLLAPALAAQDNGAADNSADNSADLFADLSGADLSGTGTAGAVSAGTETGAFNLQLSGSHEAAVHAPAWLRDGNDSYAGDIKKPSFLNEFGAEVKDGDVKLVSRWGFDLSPLTADAQDPNGNWASAVTIRPYENYVCWSPARLRLSAGYQVFSWGVADRKNPTDNLNPRDYTVGVNPDKMPVLSGDAVWYPTDSVSVEGVFIPSKQASQYPEDFAARLAGQSFASIESATLNPLTGAVTPALSLYSMDSVGSPVDYPDTGTDPADLVAGGKLNFNSSGVDLSVSYLYDLDQYYTPSVAMEKDSFDLTILGPGTVIPQDYWKVASISLDRRRIQRFGGDAKATVGRFGLWLEGAWSMTENSGSGDYSVRRSRLDYTLGTDASFGPNDTCYANIQYFGTWIPGYDSDFYGDYKNGLPSTSRLSDRDYMQDFYERAMVNALGLETEGLLQGATCNLKAELADGLLTPQVTAVYALPFLYDDTNETRYGALVLNPEFDLKPVDSFHIILGADLYYAWHRTKGNDSVTLDTTGNAIGTYTPNNNVYLKAVYKWNADLKK